MAAALAADSSDSLTADLFDCAVCMEDMSDRKPRNLSCGHSFCGRCLENIAKGNKSILCPTCRNETVLPEDGVSGLPINIFISKMKASVSGIIMRSSILCGICLSQDRQTNAANVCTDCKVNMCEPCRDYHLKMRIFNDHKFTLLHSEETLCSDHRRTIDYVCMECKKGLCVHCTMHTSHQAHTDQIKQLESGMVAVKEKLNSQASKVTEMMKNIQQFACCLVGGQSLEISKEFSCLFDGLLKETDKYKFLHKWQNMYPKLEDIYNLSTNLATNLDLYCRPMLKRAEKPEYKIPDPAVKPVHISTFDEHLGFPGEVAFLEDNSVICLDTQSKTVSRISVDHGLVANYCLPNNEKVTCLATQGKYFYLGGNKHVMKIPMLSNMEPSEYIRLPEVQEGLDQLQVLKDGSFMMKDRHIIQTYHPETNKTEKLSTMDRNTTYTFLCLTRDETIRFISKPVCNEIYANSGRYYGKYYLQEPKSSLNLENMLLVADHQNWRIVAYDIRKKNYKTEVLTRADGVRWPVGLAYNVPYLCVTESNIESNWSRVSFYKWTG